MSAGRMNPSMPGADRTSANRKIVREQMLRLLPVQILLTAVGAVNGFASSFFASRAVEIQRHSPANKKALTVAQRKNHIAVVMGFRNNRVVAFMC